MILETPRLRLEPYNMTHLDRLFEINSNPDVMRHIAPVQSRDETRAYIENNMQRFKRLGHGWWAVIETATGHMVGGVCIQHTAHVETAELEVGWRLHPDAQGQGYATEAAIRALDFAFQHLRADHVIAVAAPESAPSHRVMQRIGMQYRGVEMHYGTDLTTYVIYHDDPRPCV